MGSLKRATPPLPGTSSPVELRVTNQPKPSLQETHNVERVGKKTTAVTRRGSERTNGARRVMPTVGPVDGGRTTISNVSSCVTHVIQSPELITSRTVFLTTRQGRTDRTTSCWTDREQELFHRLFRLSFQGPRRQGMSQCPLGCSVDRAGG